MLNHVDKALHDVVEESIRNVYVGLSEEDLIAHSRHKLLERGVLLIRNIAVAIAFLLFLISIVPSKGSYIYKGVGYLLGSAAYLCEIILLTDGFTAKVPHKEMFMAYCFGPMYIMLGISYFVSGH